MGRGLFFNSYYGSFPHSLLGTSKFYIPHFQGFHIKHGDVPGSMNAIEPVPGPMWKTQREPHPDCRSWGVLLDGHMDPVVGNRHHKQLLIQPTGRTIDKNSFAKWCFPKIGVPLVVICCHPF